MMKMTLRRIAGRLASVVREMHEGQRRMLVLRTAMDRYVENSGTAPDTYAEFLLRTSGVLLHEPPAHKRLRKGGRLAV
ncbi:MAG TPA: hypothetical protein VMI73_14945 [Trebonia sp.]|nr:hypothetical protein [Trebonia sp.]